MQGSGGEENRNKNGIVLVIFFLCMYNYLSRKYKDFKYYFVDYLGSLAVCRAFAYLILIDSLP